MWGLWQAIIRIPIQWKASEGIFCGSRGFFLVDPSSYSSSFRLAPFSTELWGEEYGMKITRCCGLLVVCPFFQARKRKMQSWVWSCVFVGVCLCWRRVCFSVWFLTDSIDHGMKITMKKPTIWVWKIFYVFSNHQTVANLRDPFYLWPKNEVVWCKVWRCAQTKFPILSKKSWRETIGKSPWRSMVGRWRLSEIGARPMFRGICCY